MAIVNVSNQEFIQTKSFYQHKPVYLNRFLLLFAFLGNVPPHLAQPCYVSLDWTLIWGLYQDEAIFRHCYSGHRLFD